MSDLLKLRKEMKEKRPNFRRQDFQRPSLGDAWRQPKGMHSKLRRKRRGHATHPSPGFSAPKAVRGLHPSGLKQIIISALNQLETIKKGEGVLISSKVGIKKKLELIKKAQELKLPLLNIKNIEEFTKQIEEKRKQIKEKQKEKQTKKEQREKQAEKTKEKKKEETTEEVKEKQQKEEKRKVLEGK